MTEWRKGGGTDLISKCCSLWECWCCPPLKFTPSSPFSSSLSSTCCPWRPTSPRWVDPYTQTAKDTVLGSMVSVGSKKDCFPLFSTPLTTKRKASRTCLRGLGIGFQQRVWRWVKNPLRSVVSLETCIRARTGNCSYKTLIFYFFLMQKCQNTWEFVANVYLFCLFCWSLWNSFKLWKAAGLPVNRDYRSVSSTFQWKLFWRCVEEDNVALTHKHVMLVRCARLTNRWNDSCLLVVFWLTDWTQLTDKWWSFVFL